MLRFGQVFCALFYQPLLGHQYFSNWMQRLLKLDANLQPPSNCSIPIHLLFNLKHTDAVVPLPRKKSSTKSFGSEPASIIILTNPSGLAVS